MFEAANSKDWEKVQTKHRKIFDEKLEEGEACVQLRLQGIDALETHYGPRPLPFPSGMRGKSYSKANKPVPGNFRQPADYGDQATHKLLEYLGVEDLKWGSRFGRKWIKEIEVKRDGKLEKIKDKGEDRLEGYIIVNDMDRRGRPISWVFGGKTRTRSGKKLSDADLLDDVKESANYRLVANGLVYPYFYMTLSAALREPLIYGVRNAQRQKMKLWSEDKTQKGIKLERFSQLTESHLIFPYLFRRLVRHQFKQHMFNYWEAVDKKKSFTADEDELYLDKFFEETNPYVFKVDERDFVRLDSVAHIDKEKFQLTTHPGNIVFLS